MDGRDHRSSIDVAAEDLLDHLHGPAREARLDLIRELAADGASVEELRAAITEDRLVLLPLERLVAGDACVSSERLAALCGLDPGFVSLVRHALGLREAALDEPVFREADVETFRRLGRLRRETRLSDEGMLEIIGVLGHGLWRTSEAVLTVVAEALAQAGDTEREIAARYVEAATALRPLAGPFLESAMRAHLVEGLRTEIVTPEEIASGRVDDTEEVAVCFVDLVGFTHRGEHAPVEEILGMTQTLADVAAAAARPPVRLVKMIGDAAMLVSTDGRALFQALQSLLAAIEAHDDLPSASAGLAQGPALTRSGDWHGRTVILASRLADLAPPGGVLATREMRDALEDGREWSATGVRRLKGVESEVEVFQLRPNAS